VSALSERGITPRLVPRELWIDMTCYGTIDSIMLRRAPMGVQLPSYCPSAAHVHEHDVIKDETE